MPPQRSASSLAILFSVVIIDLIGFGIVMPVLPFYADELGASPLELGALLSIYAVMQFLFAPLWGRLSDRIGRRPVLITTIFGTGASLLLLGLADSLVWMAFARLLAGTFAANISVASAYIADVTTADERTRWMGVLGASFGVGFVLGPAIGGLLAPYGYGVPMLVAAALAAANGVHAVISLKEPERHHREAPSSESRWQVLRHPGVRRFFLTNLAFSLGVTQLESMFAFFMMDRFAYDARSVAFILVGMAVVMGAIQGGGMRRLVDAFGERRLMLGGFALLALAFAAMPSMPTVPLLLAPLALSAVGRGISQPALMGLVSFQATDANRGAVMGTFQSAASLARAAGPSIAGLLYGWNDAWPFWMAAVLVAAALVLAIGVPVAPGSAAGSGSRQTP